MPAAGRGAKGNVRSMATPRTAAGLRAQARERLAAHGQVDLLVIGAGVIGAATAWAAAEQGASVAVVDRGDIAGATSSASSKLLHGGLRYLAMGDLGLVREAHAERRANARVVAPHLVRPLEFVIPVGGDTPLKLWQVRAGVYLYAALSGFRDGRSGHLGLAAARARVPQLVTAGLRGAVLYHDHQTNDARLTVAALQGAAARGAFVFTHTDVVSLRTAAGAVAGAEVLDRLSGERFAIPARRVVNATGPWVDRMRRMESPSAGTSVRLSKGAHLLLRGGEGWTAAVTTPLPGGRVSFAIPWEGMLLLGTTDEPFDGDPAGVAATAEDRDQILREARISLTPDAVAESLVVSSFAGVRVLPLSDGQTSRTRRETIVSTGPFGMVSVAGGKLTTWRAIGARAAGQALGDLGLHGPTGSSALPGAAPLPTVDAALRAGYPQLASDVRAALAHHYGMLALDVLRPAVAEPGLLERIHPDAPEIWAQVVYARDHEWAATAEDVLHDRTTLSLRGLAGDGVRDRVARILEGG